LNRVLHSRVYLSLFIEFGHLKYNWL